MAPSLQPNSKFTLSVFFAVVALVFAATVARAQDPLPSWNDGPAKQAIVDFVAKVTKEGSPDFVPPAERIATFDNDGTLWAEQPMYFQFLFALDRVKALAPQHPEWKDKEPFASLLKGDVKGALAGGERAMLEIVMATHAGMTTEEFEQIVKDWLATAKHPKFKRPLHRDGLSADARTARLPARERLQDLHRLRRRHRVHAPVDGKGLWHPARTGRRQQHQDEVRDARRQAGARAAAGDRTSLTTRPASRSASTRTSAAGPSPRSATRTATSRCWSGRRPAAARG